MFIGRTSLFQKAWQAKVKERSKKYAEDPLFQLLDTDTAELTAPRWLRLLGSLPSKYYLLGVPLSRDKIIKIRAISKNVMILPVIKNN
jgi:hypothetical protein